MDNLETTDRRTPTFHGYAPAAADQRPAFQAPLVVAISRQTGARGRAVAQRTAELLGWPLVNQEALDYMIQHAKYCADFEDPLDAAAQAWVEGRLQELAEPGRIKDFAAVENLARAILQSAARENCVVLGRGAGVIVPPESVVHVRLVAPERERIAYISELERLTWPEAEQVVREREHARQRFMAGRFGQSADDPMQFDLVLNVARLGSDGCAELIAAAARHKETPRRGAVLH